ncbi:DUF2612 domain-containing protein [Bartonella sp. LJL80]
MNTTQKFDFSVDLLKALLWQYDDAPRLQTLLRKKDVWYESRHRQFWQSWYADVFNLDTANDFGLSVWAIILDVPLTVGIEGSGARTVWGMGEFNGNFSRWDGESHKFGTNFGRDGDAVIGLNLQQKRLILKLRYYQLISRGSVIEVNRFLYHLFGEGVYVLDGLDMTFSYIFRFVPPAQTMFVLEQFDLLPRPAGVERKIRIKPAESFGFKPYYLNFDNGNFHD